MGKKIKVEYEVCEHFEMACDSIDYMKCQNAFCAFSKFAHKKLGELKYPFVMGDHDGKDVVITNPEEFIQFFGRQYVIYYNGYKRYHRKLKAYEKRNKKGTKK